MKPSRATPFYREAAFWEVLRWCVPALVVGLVLRIAMEARMPWGFLQYDTGDFLLTPFRLLADHHYIIHSKKAFFTPTFFAVPFLLHIPALLFIPVAQHALGLVEVVMAGGLIRLWLPGWRWIIVPATTLIAASPWQLWYEQTLMGEANYVFFLFLVALLGTWWAGQPGWGRFACFAGGLFLLCGTRAEGKIMMLYGLALAPLALWPQWRAMLAAVACLAGAYLIADHASGGSHAFSLLYATLFQMTPDDIRTEPETAPYLLPLRDQTIAEGPNSADTVDLAKKITDRLEAYLHEKRGVGKKTREALATIERNLAMEILERRPLEVLMMPLVKFQMASDGWASGAAFDEHALHEKQPQAARRISGEETRVLSKGLTGEQLDDSGLQRWIQSHYDTAGMRWFTEYEKAWNWGSITPRLPDRPIARPRWAHDFISVIPQAEYVVPGVPVYFLVALAGMIVAVLLPSRYRRVQGAWLAAMLATWYAATMVGVTNARFRFAYEPFCWMYAISAVVWTVKGLGWLVARQRMAKTADAPPPNPPICIAS